LTIKLSRKHNKNPGNPKRNQSQTQQKQNKSKLKCVKGTQP